MESLIALIESAIATPINPAIAPEWAGQREAALRKILERLRGCDVQTQEAAA